MLEVFAPLIMLVSIVISFLPIYLGIGICVLFLSAFLIGLQGNDWTKNLLSIVITYPIDIVVLLGMFVGIILEWISDRKKPKQSNPSQPTTIELDDMISGDE